MHTFTNYKFETFKRQIRKANSVETDLSDHDHMIYTMLKTIFETFEPKKSIYRNFKQYDSHQLKLDIFNSMSAMRTHAAFNNNFVSILCRHAPKKKNL